VQRADTKPDGFCRRFDEPTWGQVEFSCPGYEAKDEAARGPEERRARVASRLRANPGMRVAFDVDDAPLEVDPGAPVSVVLAVRHGEQILSGEVHVPRERWDPVLFLMTLEETSRRPT
jgi:hypothetical protein